MGAANDRHPATGRARPASGRRRLGGGLNVLLCHCRAVSDRVIRTAIACGARCPEDVARACGAGTDCGGCRPAVDDLLAEADIRSVATAARCSA